MAGNTKQFLQQRTSTWKTNVDKNTLDLLLNFYSTSHEPYAKIAGN